MHKISGTQDGVVENIFHLLWLKNEFTEQSEQQKLNFKLPHTIIFRRTFPCFWYYSNKLGQIIRKKANHINSKHIKESFLKQESRSGIAAQWLYENKNSKVCHIQYIMFEELEAFINDRSKAQNGILQRFVECLRSQNTVTEVVWSPIMSIFQQRINKLSIDDKRFEAVERAATFDGNQVFSEPFQIKNKIWTTFVSSELSRISEYISDVTMGQVNIIRMIMYLKIDKAGKTNLLWCGSMRDELFMQAQTGIDSKVSSRTLDFNTMASNVILNKITYSTNRTKPFKISKDIKCGYCDASWAAKDLVYLNYGTIITKFGLENDVKKQYQQIQVNKQNLQKDSITMQIGLVNCQKANIPQIFQKLYPLLTQDEYSGIKESPGFRNKQIQVCLNCYMQVLSHFHSLAGNEPHCNQGSYFVTEEHLHRKNKIKWGLVAHDQDSMHQLLSTKPNTIISANKKKQQLNSSQLKQKQQKQKMQSTLEIGNEQTASFLYYGAPQPQFIEKNKIMHKRIQSGDRSSFLQNNKIQAFNDLTKDSSARDSFDTTNNKQNKHKQMRKIMNLLSPNSTYNSTQRSYSQNDQILKSKKRNLSANTASILIAQQQTPKQDQTINDKMNYKRRPLTCIVSDQKNSQSNQQATQKIRTKSVSMNNNMNYSNEMKQQIYNKNENKGSLSGQKKIEKYIYGHSTSKAVQIHEYYETFHHLRTTDLQKKMKHDAMEHHERNDSEDYFTKLKHLQQDQEQKNLLQSNRQFVRKAGRPNVKKSKTMFIYDPVKFKESTPTPRRKQQNITYISSLTLQMQQ